MGQQPLRVTVCLPLLLAAELRWPHLSMLQLPVCKIGMADHGMAGGMFVSSTYGFMTVVMKCGLWKARFKDGWKKVE